MDDKDAHAETIAWLQVEAEREGLRLKAVYDASLWASVYLQVHVWAPGPKVWRPTKTWIRVSDHPPKQREKQPEKNPFSVHPGGMTPEQALAAARRQVRAEENSKRSRNKKRMAQLERDYKAGRVY